MITQTLIEQTREGRVLHLALNRPEKRNALTVAMCRELVNAFDQADTDSSIGAIVLSGNGPSFCAGMDLRESLDTDQVQMAGIHERLYSTIQRIRTPIISAVHGAALAGGTGLVANTHIVIARPDARFGLTEVRVGLWPVLIFRAMEMAIGERRSVELSLTAREFTAAEAVEYGLVTEVAAEPLTRALELAQTISSYSPIAISVGLDYVHQVRGHNWDHAGKIGRTLRERLLSNDDYREGVQAFTEKRAPVWPSLQP
jgi:enoyl-CoA hydratase/carnithine racemase